MKGINFQSEVLHVPVPIGFPLEYLDLVVKPFQWPSRYSEVEPVQDTRTMTEQRFDELPKHLNGCCPSPCCPGSKEFLGLFPGVLKPELPQFFFQVVSFGQRLVDLKSLLKLFTFLSFIVQV